MKKFGVVFLLLLFFTVLSADKFEYNQSFEFPDIDNNGEYVQIRYDDCMSFGDEGAPLMPWKGINLLLAPNEQLSGVNILDIEYYTDI